MQLKLEKMTPVISSPDTSIFISAYIGKNENERIQSTMLIGQEIKNSPNVLVNSVKKEFDDITNELHATIETLVFHLNLSKSLDEAIKLLPETTLLDKKELKNGLKILDLDIKDIEKDLKKRQNFVNEITLKFSDIKQDFAYYSNKCFNKDKLTPDQVKTGLETTSDEFDKINQKYGKIVHYPDKEHWIRTALTDKNKQTQFITKDYFGLKSRKQEHNEVTKRVEDVINEKLVANFCFSFK